MQQCSAEEGLNERSGLIQVQASHADAAIGPQTDGPVRTDQVLALDLLHAVGQRQRDRHARVFQDIRPQVSLDLLLGLLERQSRHADHAVGRSQVDHSFRIDTELAGDGLLGQSIRHLDQQRVQWFDAIRRLGDNAQGVDQENIGRFQDVRGQGGEGQLARHQGHRLGARVRRRTRISRRRAAWARQRRRQGIQDRPWAQATDAGRAGHGKERDPQQMTPMGAALHQSLLHSAWTPPWAGQPRDPLACSRSLPV